MADDVQTNDGEAAVKKRSKLPMLIGVVLAGLFGGGGFYAVYSGMVLAPPNTDAAMAATSDDTMERLPLPDVSFIPLQPLVINLGAGSASRHLKFEAQLEVKPDAEAEVRRVLPRVTDVLNGYLRAIKVEKLEEPTALVQLRAQMLRRVQIVTGEGRVRDLLIMEFVLN